MGREHEGVTAVVIASVLSCPANKRKQKAKEFDYNTFTGIDCWIWDTGSGVDICGREYVPANGSGLVQTDAGLIFHTANGTVDAGPMYPGMLLPFSEAIAPYVLESTPPLLSAGKRCMKKGHGWVFLVPLEGAFCDHAKWRDFRLGSH